MQETMPQELEVRYILPAIRRELAKALIEKHKLSQKETAKLLGLTEAAVSQYLHSKRAKEVIFSEEVVDEILKSAETILNEKTRQKVMSETFRISSLAKVKHILCDLHRAQSKDDLAKCNICFEDGSLLEIKK
jgi:uncharacterized protein